MNADDGGVCRGHIKYVQQSSEQWWAVSLREHIHEHIATEIKHMAVDHLDAHGLGLVHDIHPRMRE